MKTTISPKLLTLVFATSFLLGISLQAAAPRENSDEATFTTIDFPDATFTNSYDINPAGEIVGRYVSADGQTHGYLRSKHGEFTSIDFPRAVFTVAAGINARGEIVGMYRLAREAMMVRHGFLRSKDGTFTTFDFPGATFTSAKGINPRGDIVGEYCKDFAPCAFGLGNKVKHGYLLSRGEFTSIDFPDAIETNAFKINPAGQIVGSYRSTDGKGHVFVLSEGEFTAINFPGAFETPFHNEGQNGGINSRGDIVSGYCDAAPCRDDNGSQHGFLLSKGEFTSIDFPGATWTAAFGINPGGDIVGVYVDTGGKVHGFLLRREERDEDRDDEDSGQYSCADPNVASPPLQWSNPPQATVSFALIFHDTDAAPANGAMDVTNWILWNIPASATQLAGNVKVDASPDGIVQGKNIRGANGYQGPCPPPGATPHHYIFELYALDQKLDLPAGASRVDLLKAIDGHVIGKATYVGLFGR